jgi:uncharacterized protein (DUF427 family)
VKAVWNGLVIADSEQTIELAGYRCFPRTAVRRDLLTASRRSAADLRCPHGVRFYDVSDGERRSARAAWSYEAPLPGYRRIDHWIGFWEDVEVAE